MYMYPYTVANFSYSKVGAETAMCMSHGKEAVTSGNVRTVARTETILVVNHGIHYTPVPRVSFDVSVEHYATFYGIVND